MPSLSKHILPSVVWTICYTKLQSACIKKKNILFAFSSICLLYKFTCLFERNVIVTHILISWNFSICIIMMRQHCFFILQWWENKRQWTPIRTKKTWMNEWMKDSNIQATIKIENDKIKCVAIFSSLLLFAISYGVYHERKFKMATRKNTTTTPWLE